MASTELIRYAGSPRSLFAPADARRQAYELLQESLERVLTSYAIMDEVVERTQVSFATEGSDDAALRELYGLLKPDAVLSGMVTKQWQDVRQFSYSPSS